MAGFYVKSLEGILPILGPCRFDFVNRCDGQSVASIMIGRNGSGKSTILREITLALRAIADLKARNRTFLKTSWHVIQSLRFISNSDFLFDEETFQNIRKKSRGGMELDFALPSKLIALSFTPFDKFPHPNLVRDDQGRKIEEPFYVYLGFKSDGGLMSARRRLFFTLDDLIFSQLTEIRDDRVCGVMNAIGYQPKIKVSYRLSSRVRDYMAHVKRSDRERVSYKDYRISPSSMELVDHLLSSASAEDLLINRGIEIVVDFELGSSKAESLIDPQLIQSCVKSQVFMVDSVTLHKTDSKISIDLLDLSSGELNLFTGFLGLAVHLQDNALVLIDEPENSLHPEWQIRYTEMLQNVFSRYSGCHYIIATHSPLVVSGAAEIGAFVLRLDQNPIMVDASNFVFESPDSTLVNAFDVVTAGNNYIKQLALEGLTLIEQGEAQSQRAQDIAKTLSEVLLQIPETDPIREIVVALLLRVSE